MKIPHAFGFVLLGLFLLALPRLVPGLFPPGLFARTGVREVWTLLMGGLQFGLGAGYLALRGLAALGRMLAYVPSATAEVVTAVAEQAGPVWPGRAAAEGIEESDTYEPAALGGRQAA